MSKFTPATVIVLGAAVVAMVNDTVAVTPTAAATLLDSTIEVAVSAALTVRAGAAAPALTPSADVFTVKPVLLLAAAGPVVNSPAAKVIFDEPTGKAEAVVHTMVSVAAVNVQVDIRVAVPDTGTKVPAGVALPLK